MNSRGSFLILFSVTSFIVIFQFFILSPLSQYEFSFFHQPIHSENFVIASGSAPSPTASTFQLFQDASRNNRIKLRGSFTKLATPVEFERLNYGRHLASKSSPAIDNSGIYVGTDLGDFIAFDFDGKERWKLRFPLAVRGVHGTATLDDHSLYIGDYAGVLRRLEKETGQIIWSTPLGHAIGTSPLLKGGFLYVSYESSSPLRGYMAKIDALNGQVLWNSQAFPEQSHSSPSYDEKNHLLFFADNSGRLHALSEEDGRLVWNVDFEKPIKSPPVLSNGRIYVGGWDGKIHCLEAATGEVLWTTEIRGEFQSNPVVSEEKKELLILSPSTKSLLWLDLATGKKKSSLPLNLSPRQALAGILLINSSQEALVAPCEEHQICLISVSSKKILAKSDLKKSFSSVPQYYRGKLWVSLDQGGLTSISLFP